MMVIAAIYARKSTEQTGVADEQKSVARQIEHARVFAASKGWTVDDAHVYVDDGISGAEFANRPGFLRLMNALKPRPAFQVLIMSEESRLGREQIEVSYALKQTVQAGVRIMDTCQTRRNWRRRPLLHAISTRSHKRSQRRRASPLSDSSPTGPSPYHMHGIVLKRQAA
jgi:DNA invertase Pin-like site-specific DNA recombinase